MKSSRTKHLGIPLALSLVMSAHSGAKATDCVVLLHGLARSPSSMSLMDKALVKAGFSTVNQGYPSRDYPIEVLADQAIDTALSKCPAQSRVNFVTHSMGGILVRQYLSKHKLARLRRVVMLGPPNQGSEVVDKLGAVPGFKWINGEAGLQLGTGSLSVPNRLGPADFEVGIIAGSKSINLILSKFIPGTDDGKVSVERTKLAGMSDHMVAPVAHPFLMHNKKVIAQVVYFLNSGKFKQEG
ncbi:MAG: alpha/beta hydrolase [Cellvibrionaceae bacterium]|nr:alpha/beta hydrolase [Cellvibrionaceae bacterium]